MRRDIKFRAWDEADGYHMDISEMSYNVRHDCDADVIMQYTGLKDKNGKDIYEGDIVSVCFSEDVQNSILEVFYNESNCSFSLKNNSYKSSGIPSTIVDIIEVIGNIYENKELLKKLKYLL